MRIAREITGGGLAGLVLGLSLRVIMVLCASPRIPAIETAAPRLPQTSEDPADSQTAADILRQCRCNVKETDVPIPCTFCSMVVRLPMVAAKRRSASVLF